MTDQRLSTFPTATCPLCGEPNQCSMANSCAEHGRACWCFDVVIDRSQLAQLPPQTEGTGCICPSCAAKEGQPSEKS